MARRDNPTAVFLGDLADPWVDEIARAMPRGSRLVGCDGDLPAPPSDAQGVVVHRPILTANDGLWMREIRERAKRLILVVGPHVRARDLERWGTSADVVLSEATASEVVARYLLGPTVEPKERAASKPITIVAASFESRKMLAEACRAAGFSTDLHASWDQAPATSLAIWDTPVLDQGWEEALRGAAEGRSILTLIGFADRQLVTRAKEAGAAACLDFPCDVADLAFVLDRMRDRIGEPPHRVPPAPMGLKTRAGLRPAIEGRHRRDEPTDLR